MTEWLKNNLWSLVIAIVTMTSMYTLYGAQISDLQRRTQNNADAIKTVQAQENTNNVILAEIQKDIEYIKVELNRIETKQGQ